MRKEISTAMTEHQYRPVVLVILDGWGIGRDEPGNAVLAPKLRPSIASGAIARIRNCVRQRRPLAYLPDRWAIRKSAI